MMKVEFALRHILAVAAVSASVMALLVSPLSAGERPDQPADPRFVRFEIDLRLAVPVEDPVEADLWLRHLGPGEPSAEMSRVVPIPIQLTMLTGRGKLEEYWLTAEGWWSPRVRFRSGEDEGPLILTAFPTSSVVGELAPLGSVKTPAEVEIRFQQAAGTTAAVPVPAGTVRCPLTGRRFACALPQGTLDLRIVATEGSELRLPGRKVPTEGVLDLGSLSLATGSSEPSRPAGAAP
jgi:hypothetical protein